MNSRFYGTTSTHAARQPAVDLWRKTLQQIPTVFGRLVYLSSLRDASTNRYGHGTLTAMLGEEDADRTLCNCHHQVFSQWIGSSLAEQKADLDEYVKDHGGRMQLPHHYRDLVPPAAREVERQLYVTDLEMLAELLRYGNRDVSLFPGS